MRGFGQQPSSLRPQDQVLRNQSVGSRCSARRLGPAVGDRDADQDVVGRGLRVLGEDVEVAVVVEDAGVGELELGLVACRGARFSSTSRAYGNSRLRVLVERLQVRVRRRRVEVEVRLLHVLAVVALGAGQAEQPLLQDRVAAVPQREREAEPALAVGDAEQAVLAPAVGAAARVVVREVVPARRRRPSSPRAPCPTGARRGTAPSASSCACARRPRAGAAAPRRARARRQGWS